MEAITCPYLRDCEVGKEVVLGGGFRDLRGDFLFWRDSVKIFTQSPGNPEKILIENVS
jgi:hypothetical protein